jgi:hypothetical protein
MMFSRLCWPPHHIGIVIAISALPYGMIIWSSTLAMKAPASLSRLISMRACLI